MDEVRKILEKHGYRDPVLWGSGSFSKVYRVRDTEGNFWACKVTPVTNSWERECHNWSTIHHPRFPEYREHWKEADRGYLVIEFWDGKDLSEWLRRRESVSAGQALRIASQLAEGLQYLHERPHPFLYRDLKPENVRIRVDGSIGILDLGCLWDREQTGSLAGNAAYSAPEQFRAEKIPGEESDVYALGRLLLAMLGAERESSKEKREKKGKNGSPGFGRAGKEATARHWLLRIGRLAAMKERRKRIPDMASFVKLLECTQTSRRVKKRCLTETDFYFERKLYYP